MPGSFYTGNGGAPAWNGGPGAPAGPTARTDFVHIKNAGDHTYLNCKNGVLGCTAIDCSWGGAQWDLIPVPGTNSFLIRNRWNQGFLNTDNGSLLLGDGNSPGARWAFEPSGNDNSWYIVNTGNNTLLLGQKWIIE